MSGPRPACRQYGVLVSSPGDPPRVSTVDVPRAATEDPQSRTEWRWNLLRHGLVIAWLLVAAAVIGFGERAASWQDVEASVAAGEVQSVRVIGEMPSGGTGYSVVDVAWRDGLLAYHAEVVHVRGDHVSEARTAAGEDIPLLRTSPTRHLQQLQPGLAVTEEQQRSTDGELLGWRVPTALALGAFGLFLAWLSFLVTGPQPWRATRWAWFWLAFPPVGIIAHLLLSGPTPGIPAPRRPERRLTGGWAFLIYLVVAAAVFRPV